MAGMVQLANRGRVVLRQTDAFIPGSGPPSSALKARNTGMLELWMSAIPAAVVGPLVIGAFWTTFDYACQ
jgi:hypothetical protein